MTGVLGTVRGLFVQPVQAPEAPRSPRAATLAVVGRVAVLCASSEAAAAGSITALTAARAARSTCAVVCTWTGPDGVEGQSSGGSGVDGPSADRSGFAVAAARRLAGRLGRRGVPARARGRLVRVDLPSDPGEARVLAERVAGAAGEVPVVTVIAGTRPEDFDRVLADQDRVVVVPPRGELAEVGRLAVLEAARVARAVGVLELPQSGAARFALAPGLAMGPAARRAAIAALA